MTSHIYGRNTITIL